MAGKTENLAVKSLYQRLYDMNRKLPCYLTYKQDLNARIAENCRWYSSAHWDLINSKTVSDSIPEPISAYLFYAIASRHAEVMDRFPKAKILERDPEDTKEAAELNALIDYQLQTLNFKKVYSDIWWHKLKYGMAAYGVFFDPKLLNGMGDIVIKRLDLLNLYWEPGIENIQDSKYLFITALVDKEEVLSKYPHLADRSEELKKNYSYFYKNADINQDKLLIVDGYYKKRDGYKTYVHMIKFCGDFILDATEISPITAKTGLYDHGLYPVVIDAMYSVDGCIEGFGLIDVIKNQQSYIDRLDAIISENALISGKMRWLIKDNGGVNENELLDISNDLVHVAGPISDEHVRPLQASAIDPSIMEHRQTKIKELKEISGNRNVMQGEVPGGITAYRSIMALQEAGSKLIRDNISSSYEAFRQVVFMMIELVRQFYSAERIIRTDRTEFLRYSNKNLKSKPLERAHLKDTYRFRIPTFDIKVAAENQSPIDKEIQNQLGIELFEKGFFVPERSGEALAALNLMSFEGKERIKFLIEKNLKSNINSNKPVISPQKAAQNGGIIC